MMKAQYKEFTIRSRKRAALLLAWCAIALCGAYFNLGATKGNNENTARKQDRGATSNVIDLGNLDKLKRLFERHRGNVRLVSLLSPT